MRSRSRILVIDDDQIFRNLVFTLLRKDFLVSVASDGETGFQKAREHRPDLVIIDFQMPGWNGLKTLKAFRSNRSLSTVKVMMLTSDASKETVLAAIQAGTDDYTIKTGFNKADFLTKINKLLAPVLVKAVNPNATTATPFSSQQKPLFDSGASSEATAVAIQADPNMDSGELSIVDDALLSQANEDREEERLSEIMEEWE